MKFLLKILFLALFSLSAFSMDTMLQIGQPFIRLTKSSQQTDLMLASRTYRLPSSNLKVTLLSAMHFAKSEFYKKHNEILNQATIVLYEGKGLDKKWFAWNELSEIKKYSKLNCYKLCSQAYNLAYQLESINYRQSHFILADYSFDEEYPNPDNILKQIKEFMAELDEKYSKEAIGNEFEDGFSYFVNLQVENQKKQPFSATADMLFECGKNPEEILQKDIPAELYDKEYTKRNQIILAKFAEEMAKIKANSASKIVIYYGAGHLSYIEQELCKQYGLVFESNDWLSAVSY